MLVMLQHLNMKHLRDATAVSMKESGQERIPEDVSTWTGPHCASRLLLCCLLKIFVLGYSPGWLVHWGEKMANTSAEVLTDYTTRILQYNNNSGSVSFYMLHGGTNFGFTAGDRSLAATPAAAQAVLIPLYMSACV